MDLNLEAPVDEQSRDLLNYMKDMLAERDKDIQHQFEAVRSAVGAALAATEKAVLKAEAATEKRFDNVNEFRGILTDQTAKFPTRTEVDQRFVGIEEAIAQNRSRLDRIEGSSSGRGGSWTTLVQLVGLLGSLIAIGIALTR
jgi:hypothetical protein